MLTECLYCKKDPFNPTPQSPHYCEDCIGTCTQCHKLKGVWEFNFDFNSEGYKKYKAAGSLGKVKLNMIKSICGQCERESDTDPIKQLQRTVAKLKPGQLELILKIQKGEK